MRDLNQNFPTLRVPSWVRMLVTCGPDLFCTPYLGVNSGHLEQIYWWGSTIVGYHRRLSQHGREVSTRPEGFIDVSDPPLYRHAQSIHEGPIRTPVLPSR